MKHLMEQNEFSANMMESPRGVAEIEIEPGVGFVIYKLNDEAKLKEIYDQFSPVDDLGNAIDFKTWVSMVMSKPGTYTTPDGQAYKIIEIGDANIDLIDKTPGKILNKYFGMLYSF